MLVAAVWLGAWLQGRAPADDVLDALTWAARSSDSLPVRVDLPGEAAPSPLADLLSWLRVQHVDRAWLVLPRPGSALGWPVPAAEPPLPAVLATRTGLPVGLLCPGQAGLRVIDASGVAVAQLEANALSVRVAARRFSEIVTDSAEQIGRLGLDRPARKQGSAAWSRALVRLPRDLDPALPGLLHRIASVLDALALARLDEGAAVTAVEAIARDWALRGTTDALEDLLVGVIAGLGATVGA